MMVVRVSLDQYNLLQQEAEQLEISVSALVRAFFSFNYYPELASVSLRQAREDLADNIKQAQLLDTGLAEYEARLTHLSEDLELYRKTLAGERERAAEAREVILGVLKNLALDSDDE